MIFWSVAAVAAELEISVRDRQGGDPIPGARIGGISTDERGRARIAVQGEGPWTLRIEADGFGPATVETDREQVRVWLTRSGGELEIVVEGLKRTADPSRHSVDGEMALETPGTLDDSVRLVQALPGVTVQREYAPSSGDLSVRGSAPGDSRYYLDGVEIPYLYHFNQYASVFPSTQIGRLELYPSTFAAHYGDAVGAIVDVTSRLEPPRALHGGLSLNYVMGGADLSAPVGKRWWLSGSGRRSYQDLAGERSAQYTVWPTFHDFALRAERGDAERGVGLFAIGAGDSYTRAAGELDLLDPVEAESTPYLAYRQGFQLLGGRSRWRGALGEGRWVAALVHHRRSGDLAGLGSETLESWTLTSRLDATLRPSSGPRWDLGYELSAARIAMQADEVGPAGVRVAEEAPALARGAPVNDAMGRLRGGIYGTGHLERGPMALLPGLRIAADSTRAEVQLEPRGAIRWSVGESAMLKIGGGRYTQRPEAEHLFPGTGDPDLPTTRSWQLSVGWEQAVASRLEIGADAYRKWLTDPLLFPIDSPASAVPRGDAWGVELLTRYRLRERVFLWAWVAVQRTTVERPDGEVVPADGDQLLSGGAVFSWDVGRWTLGARYRYASGLPFTPIEGSLYDAGLDRWLPLLGAINAERLPDYHKVDLRAAYRIPLRGWSMELVGELWAVPEASAQLYPTWNYDYTEQGWVQGPTLLPLFGVRARF